MHFKELSIIHYKPSIDGILKSKPLKTGSVQADGKTILSRHFEGLNEDCSRRIGLALA